jgi:ABC-type dipeptide/oligopeptide/nickel transport system ATPase component
MPLLDIRNLTIEIDTPRARSRRWTGQPDPERGDPRPGGESGSGKSLVAKVIVGIQKDNWTVRADRMRFNDMDLLTMAPERRRIMGREMAMIFQDPISCLDPSEEIGTQLEEAIPTSAFTGKFWQRFQWRKKPSPCCTGSASGSPQGDAGLSPRAVGRHVPEGDDRNGHRQPAAPAGGGRTHQRHGVHHHSQILRLLDR